MFFYDFRKLSMYKIISFLGLMLLGVGVGFGVNKEKDPYKLDYNRIAINLHVAHTKMFEDMRDIGLGEVYLAQDIMDELKENGFGVRLFAWEDTYSNRNYKEGIEFFMRVWPELSLDGYHDFVDKDRVAVLFETIPSTLEQLKNADLIFTGSLKKNREYLQMESLPNTTQFMLKFNR